MYALCTKLHEWQNLLTFTSITTNKHLSMYRLLAPLAIGLLVFSCTPTTNSKSDPLQTAIHDQMAERIDGMVQLNTSMIERARANDPVKVQRIWQACDAVKGEFNGFADGVEQAPNQQILSEIVANYLQRVDHAMSVDNSWMPLAENDSLFAMAVQRNDKSSLLDLARLRQLEATRTLLNQVSSVDFKYDTLTAFALPSAAGYALNEEAYIPIVPAAFSSTSYPLLLVGELDTNTLEVRNPDTTRAKADRGYGLLKANTTSTGLKSETVLLKIKRPDGAFTSYPVEVSYMVRNESTE